MRPEYYADEMKRYARFVRNYNPKQTGAEAMQRIAVGPNQGDTAYTEAVMAAQKSPRLGLEHRRPVAALLHDRRMAAVVFEHELRRGRLRQAAAAKRWAWTT
jgi:hypothetical protein